MKPTTRFGQLISGLTIAALVMAACGSSNDDAATADDGTVAVEESSPVPEQTVADASGSTADEPASDDAPTVDSDPARPFAVDVAYDGSAEPFLLWFAPFDPGTYRTGALGTPMSFTTTEVLNSQPNGGGTFVLSDVASRGPDDRGLVFMRISEFSDPVAPNEPLTPESVWPADDFLGWLDNVHEGVIATDPVETMVNGLPAIRVDLAISDDMECGWLPGFCVGFAVNNGEEIKALNRGASYRVWVVEQGDEDPLLISADIARDDQATWFDRAAAVLDTVAFGDIAPNPTQWLLPGPAQLNALGGIRVELPENIEELTNSRPRLVNLWNGRGAALIPINERPAAIYFSDRPHDLDGTPLSTTDEVVALLTVDGNELIELDPISIDGVPTRVFDFTTDDVGAILLKYSPLDLADRIFGWDAPAAGRIWAIEHPERGLMMISTHAFDDVDALLPVVNELGETIVATLEFLG